MTASVDTILNLIWALVCLGAFGWFFAVERSRIRARRTRTVRAFALSLILLSLFPSVSLNDDSLRTQFLFSWTSPSPSTSDRNEPGGQPLDRKSLATLVRLFEVLDSAQISLCLILSVILCLFAYAISETQETREQFLLILAGRAPPLA